MDLIQETKASPEEKKPAKEVSITMKKDHFFIMLAIAFLAIGLVSGYVLGDKFGGIFGKEGGTTTGDNTPTGAVAGDHVKVNISFDGAPVLGKDTAPVTIIVFSDFSCPYCGAAAGGNEEVMQYLQSKYPDWTAPVPGIIKNYVDTGKAKLIFKYYPGHGTGEEAFKLALCANEQSKFWEVHDVFFANQDSIADIAALKDLTASAGVDLEELQACYDSKKYDDAPESDYMESKQAGVGGTPTFFIGNDEDGYVKIVGAQKYLVFEQAIEAELK